MAELVLYTNPMSRGRIARWMVEETGAEYDAVLLDFQSGMKDEKYLSINPMGKVPAIVHKGNVVTECAAICAYLADAYPAAQLGPTEAERANYYRWMFFAAGPVEQAVTAKALGSLATPEQGRMAGYRSFESMVDVLETAVSRYEFIAGDRFTAADVYVGSQILWALQFGSLPSRKAFAAYAERVSRRDAYGRATAKDDEAIAALPAGG